MPEAKYKIPPLGGLKRDLPKHLVPLHFAVDLDGMWSIYGKIRRIPGKQKYASNQLSGGAVMRFYDWIQDSGDNYLVAISQDEAYKYDNNNNVFTSIQDATTFSMEDSQYPDICSHYDSSGNEILIITDYVDDTRKWTGSGNINTLSGSPPKAKFCTPYQNFLMLGYTYESSVAYPRRVRWSDLGNGESWPANNYKDFLKTQDWLQRIISLRDRLVVYKEKSISIMDYVGGSLTFDVIENYVGGRGLVGSYAVIAYGENQEAHYFISSDLEIYHFDGLDMQMVSRNVSRYLVNIHPNEKKYIQAEQAKEYDKLVWLLPGRGQDSNKDMLIFDVKDRSFWIKESEVIAVTAMGRVNLEQTYEWDTLPYDQWDLWDDPEGWDSRTFLQNAPVILFGGADGYVRYWVEGQDDDGTDIASRFVYPFDTLDGNENTIKLVSKIIIECYNEGSGNLLFAAFTDDNDQDILTLDEDGNTYKTISLVPDDANKLFFREEIDIAITGYNFSWKLYAASGTWTARIVKVIYDVIGERLV